MVVYFFLVDVDPAAVPFPSMSERIQMTIDRSIAAKTVAVIVGLKYDTSRVVRMTVLEHCFVATPVRWSRLGSGDALVVLCTFRRTSDGKIGF